MIMEEYSNNISCGESCRATEDINMSLLLNLTADVLWSKQNGDYELKNLAGNVLTIVSFTVSLFSQLSGAMGMSIWSFAVIVAALVYIYRKIWVPYNYVQDFDLPGVSYKRRDMVNLVRRLRKMGTNLPPPYPNGWYGVIESDQLGCQEVKQVECLGESLAVFRGSNGQVHILDAFCPHLGANMAVGGSVRDDCLECPFHRWQFAGTSGKCVSIPGVDTVPKNASVRTWECREMDGMIFVWYSVDGEQPSYTLPSVPEVKDGRWIYMGRNDFLVPCHIQDIPENGADLAHLNALHSDHLVAGKCLPTPVTYNVLGRHVWGGMWSPTEAAHIATVELTHDIRFLGKLSLVHMDVTATQVGPSYVQMEIRHRNFKLVILQTVTPVAPLVQRVIHRLYAPPLFKPFGNIMVWAETVMFHRDVMIWSSKIFASQPLLVKTDKCLKAYRTWYKQFFSDKSISFEKAIKNMQNNGLEW